jgi:hypothetical protein
MTSRKLGFAVLLYAVFTSSAGLRLVGLAIGYWDGDWWAVGDVALWLSFVAGGSALIGGRAWGRAVLLVAGIASALTEVMATVSLWNADMLLASLPNVFRILVSVAFVIAARRLPTPAVPRPHASTDLTGSAEPRTPASGRLPDKRVVSHRIDVAYASFAWIAVAIWLEDLGKVLPIDPDFGQFLLMLLWVPILFVTLWAACRGSCDMYCKLAGVAARDHVGH